MPTLHAYYEPSVPPSDINGWLAEFAIDAKRVAVPQPMGQKWLKQAASGLLFEANGQIHWVAHGMKVSPNWLALQQRVVKAGKKSELLLKAAKLQADMTVIDATAGFGHDSLILGSTGATVKMVEQQPVMQLLLQHALVTMQSQPNWQKLIGRLSLTRGDALQVLPTLPKAHRVYLDPMFPQHSYKAAVGKTMQALHDIAEPPSVDQEQQLLMTARKQLLPDGKVLVKRPKNAPFLAGIEPLDSISNELVRFDSYAPL